MNLERVLLVAAIIFCTGLYGAITKKNAITILMCLELMFNAINISAVAVSRYVTPAVLAGNNALTENNIPFLLTGQVLAIFVITVAAAEVALGLAVIISIYRSRGTSDVTQINVMKN